MKIGLHDFVSAYLLTMLCLGLIGNPVNGDEFELNFIAAYDMETHVPNNMLYDFSGHGNNATIIDGTNTTGYFGDALENDINITVPDLDCYSFTIMAWIYPTGMDDRQTTLIENVGGQGLAQDYAQGVWRHSNGSMYFQWQTQFFFSNESIALLNQWNHVALTYDYETDTAIWYLNGTEKNSGTVASAHLNNGFRVGVRLSTDPFFDDYYKWRGKIDELRVFSYVLHQNAIHEAMNKPISTATAYEPSVSARLKVAYTKNVAPHSDYGNGTRYQLSIIEKFMPLEVTLIDDFKSLSNYDVLILNRLNMSDSEVTNVENFVASGGVLLYVGQSGRYKDDGTERANNPFDEALGTTTESWERGASASRISSLKVYTNWAFWEAGNTLSFYDYVKSRYDSPANSYVMNVTTTKAQVIMADPATSKVIFTRYSRENNVTYFLASDRYRHG